MDNKKEPDIHNFEDIRVGQAFEFERVLSEKDINMFAELIGDFNPMHIDEDYAKDTIYKRKISHGMLAASLFSTLLGMYCPGKDSIILSVDVNFKNPVFPNTKLRVRGEVIRKTGVSKMMSIKLSLSDGQKTLIEGKTKVKKL